jgi:hypothetical protein
LGSCRAARTLRTAGPSNDWRPLFDGKTLAGWTPKIRGFALEYRNIELIDLD